MPPFGRTYTKIGKPHLAWLYRTIKVIIQAKTTQSIHNNQKKELNCSVTLNNFIKILNLLLSVINVYENEKNSETSI